MTRSRSLLRAAALPPGEPGVQVERRSFLAVAAATLGAFATGETSAAALTGALAGPDERDTSFQKFLDEAVPVAREILADSSLAEDRYLHTIAALAVQVGDVAVPELRPSSQGERTFIGASYTEGPFVVLHWKMEPGSEIRAHAHTYGNVVTLGLEGEARVRNYEMVGSRDFETKESFRVRMTQDQLLGRGDVNLVPLEHGYVHGFVAGKQGARGLDITTRRKEKQPTPYLVLENDPIDVDARLFRGRWHFD